MGMMLHIDIVGKNVGAFKIGRAFDLPRTVSDRLGNQLVQGDIIWIEPYTDVAMGLRIETGGPLPQCLPLFARVDASSEASILDGQMAQITVPNLLRVLEENGIRVIRNSDAILYLSNDVRLGVFGINLECIWFSDIPATGQFEWKEVVDQSDLSEIIKSAEISEEKRR
jgi:hypothetical protein